MHAFLRIAFATALLGASSLWANTWGIQFDDPGQSGTHTVTITFKYTDAQGKAASKQVSATTNIDPNMNGETKRAAVQASLNAELAKPANQVNGNSLASTGGIGEFMGVKSAGDAPDQSFTDAGIASVKEKDVTTGEDDRIIKPIGKGLAALSLEGDITGSTPAGVPSVYSVATNVERIEIALMPGMRKADLLQAVQKSLEGQGATTWLDPTGAALFVLLDDGAAAVNCIGCGSTDRDLAAVCEVWGR